MVLGCNHAYLGFTRCCPARAVFGTPLNDEQRAFVKEMRARVESFRRLVGQGPSLCGGKLAGAEASLDTLARSLVNLDFIPYSRIRGGREPVQSVPVASATTGGSPPFVASEIGFPGELSDFCPRPYLSRDSLAIYEHPDSRLLPESEWGPPPHPYTVPRAELLKMAKRWDLVGRLALFLPEGDDAPKADERCYAFVVPKPGTNPPETRQILDRRARNRKEIPLRTGSRCLPHACMWLDLVIPRGMAAYFSSNDLRHMYHSFACISRERARTMVVGPFSFGGAPAASGAED